MKYLCTTLCLSGLDLSMDDVRTQFEILGEHLDNVKEMHINNNLLAGKLVDFPKNLQKLNCANNRLSELSELPTTLRELFVYGNRINTLPQLPKNIEMVVLGNTKRDEEDICIMKIPPLPSSLRMLIIHVHWNDAYYNFMEKQSDETKKSILLLLKKTEFIHDFKAEELYHLKTFAEKHRKMYYFNYGFLSSLDDNRLSESNRRNICLRTMCIPNIQYLVSNYL